MGGPHVTSSYKFILKECDFVDFASIGESENTIIEVVNRLEEGKDIEQIDGLVYKDDLNRIKGSKTPKLIEDLDKLPFPRRKEFYEAGAFKNELKILTGRGCPYTCSFCMNNHYNNLYKNQQFIRQRSVSNVINEIKYNIKKYSINKIYFYDEIFTLNNEWLKKFLKVYTEEIGLPFFCFSRIDTIDKETANLLKKSGCKRISLGVESASKRIRNLMNKRISMDEVKKTVDLLKNKEIRIGISVMFGYPTETKKEMLQTFEFIKNLNENISITANSFYPFEKTEGYELANKEKLITESNRKEIKEGGNTFYSEMTHLKDPKFVYILQNLSSFYSKFPHKQNLVFSTIKNGKKMKSELIRLIDNLFYNYPSFRKERISCFLRKIKNILTSIY